MEISKGLQLIHELSEEEIESAIDWLEDLVKAYHALLALKRTLNKRPESPLLSVLDSTLEAEPTQERKIVPRSSTKEVSKLREQIDEFLLRVGPATVDEIAQELSVGTKQVKNAIYGNRKYSKAGNCRWSLRAKVFA